MSSRNRARGLIMAGRVMVNGCRVDKAGSMVRAESDIEILASATPYVSRGGSKLEGVLQDVVLDVRGFVCLDVGASTGGFTDCLLKHGAARVYAIDVGRNLLDISLREDPRVIAIEGCNVRYVQPDLIPEKVDLITIDVSFISLTLVIPAVIPFLKHGGYLLTLIKPQFELSRQEVGKGGIVREEAVRLKAVEKMQMFVSRVGLDVRNCVPSRVKGPRGNQEYFMLSST